MFFVKKAMHFFFCVKLDGKMENLHLNKCDVCNAYSNKDHCGSNNRNY